MSPDKLAYNLLKSVNRAAREFDLLAAGDRVAVGVSGGKDSRALLDLLARGVDIPGAYHVVAVHIDGSAAGLPDLRPLLEPWFRELGVEYVNAPLAAPEDEPLPLDCFRCAKLRRKALFFAAEAADCNKVALGHHADDAAVTTLLSLLYKGRVEGLPPRRDYFDGRFTLIRPLIYLAEKDIARYARARAWELPPEPTCPRGADTRRKQIERFFAGFPPREREQMRVNLWRVGERGDREGR